ncbi:MAG TPA: KH domain-containing protein [Candidatus Thermoplasmatota archaeon]
MTRAVRVPLDRVGALIGPGGAVKAQLERRARVRLRIDSETGAVEIIERQTTNPLKALQAEEVVRAIARGFSPEHAQSLFADGVFLAVIDVREYTGARVARQREMRGRVIGEKGRTRQMIEELTGCHLAIQGNTVSAIGELEGLEVAKRAVDMLLSGSEHSTVYGFMERKRKEARMTMLDSVDLRSEESAWHVSGEEE